MKDHIQLSDGRLAREMLAPSSFDEIVELHAKGHIELIGEGEKRRWVRVVKKD